jgi:hypothetical protein
LSVIPGGAAKPSAAALARQRLEDQFRQVYRERQIATTNSPDLSSTGPQNSAIKRISDGSAP